MQLFFLILKLSFQLFTSKHKNAEKINSYFEIIGEPQKDFFLKITTVFRWWIKNKNTNTLFGTWLHFVQPFKPVPILSAILEFQF